MTNLDKVESIFSFLHDGVLVDIKGDLSQLHLKVECQYLAEAINMSHNFFIVKLKDISQIKLELWGTPKIVFDAIDEISKFDLEIISSEKFDDYVSINCYIDDDSGGNLNLNCDDIEIFDEDNKIITISQLSEISDKYWNNLR